MDQELQYKGYTIKATPNLLSETNRWSIEIMISKDRPGGAVDQQFDAGQTCPTEQEAVSHCLIFGRQIIDGKHPNLRAP